MKYPPPDMDCQDCSGHPWQAGLWTPLGYLYLCAPCAADALSNRDGKGSANRNAFSSLMLRVFKPSSQN